MSLNEIQLSTMEYAFIQTFGVIQKRAHDMAVEKGWWESEDANRLREITRKAALSNADWKFVNELADKLEQGNAGEKIALMHSELSEALEAIRHGNPSSDHIPDFTGEEEEYADVIIRIMDRGQKTNLRIAEAVIYKMRFNATRAHKHGGKKF